MTNEEFLKHVWRNVSGELEGDDIIDHADKLVRMFYLAVRIKIECHHFREHHKHEYHEHGHSCPIVEAFNSILESIEDKK